MLDIPKTYDHSKEADVYKLWESSGYFNPDNLDGKPYTIIMPPPNANAPLHVGHALGMTIEDIIIRFERMRGKKTLWLPGTDHAGFETQAVFEKKLDKEGRSRFQMTRAEFYKEIWNFVQTNKHLTEDGIKRLGASCDWSRNIFTLDERIVKIVYETFEQMYKDGLIYRAGRICNWCPKHQTGLADLETKHEERTEPFYYFQYGPFEIGTSRPETKFGDKYVVMHPDDQRYKKYKPGDTFEAEWINGKVKATVVKDEAVDMEFGSGVMTITPSHDPVDFEIAQRHKLDMEQIIDQRGKLLPIAGEFSGMKILDARPKVVEKLRSKGLVTKIDEKYKHTIALCYKCSAMIEPQIIPQWYIAMTKPMPDGRPSLRDTAIAAIKNKEVEIVTERFEKIFMNWMENLRDWPISRQIWWGIPIPVWYKDKEIKISETSPGDGWNQDPDTFDTWFSSGQWPFATLLAQKSKSDFETFYPTQIMETGWDIIFFWVARMIMLGYYKTGKPPFEKVLLHGLVRDKDRQKMSKSKGNIVDPLGIIDTYGTDALRFALVFSTAAGNDIPLSEDKIKGMKHFANKLWNISRFVLTNPDNPKSKIRNPKLTNWGEDLIKRTNEISDKVTKHLEKFEFHEAAQTIYHYTWHEFADIKIEEAKEHLKENSEQAHTALVQSLEIILKLLHPFMPFVTETIWHQFNKDLLMIQKWPTIGNSK